MSEICQELVEIKPQPAMALTTKIRYAFIEVSCGGQDLKKVCSFTKGKRGGVKIEPPTKMYR